MISKKTVELNLTAELLAWLRWVTGRVHFAIVPSQQLEAKLGFDAGFYGPGPALFIQFKRVHVAGSKYTWHLNRTTLKDQHQRLQQLELAGVPVFYAFPRFHLPAQIAAWRRRLLTYTFSFRPSRISPPGGPTGHHDVVYDDASGVWSVSSPDEGPLGPPTPLGELVEQLERESHEGPLNEWIFAVNRILFGQIDTPDTRRQAVGEPTRLDDLTSGFAMLGRAPSTR